MQEKEATNDYMQVTKEVTNRMNSKCRWEYKYPTEEEKQQILRAYEEVGYMFPTFFIMSHPIGYTLAYAFILTTILVGCASFITNYGHDWRYLGGGLLQIIMGLIGTQLLFTFLHIYSHVAMLMPSFWFPLANNPFDKLTGKRLAVPVSFHAYYHHHHTAKDDWGKSHLLGSFNKTDTAQTNAAHIHAFSVVTKPIGGVFVWYLIYIRSAFVPLLLAWELGSILIGPAHLYQHGNQFYWRSTRKLHKFLETIGIFTSSEYHRKHHDYNKMYVNCFGSFTSSGVLHPWIPQLELWADKYYDSFFPLTENDFKNDKGKHPIQQFVDSHPIFFNVVVALLYSDRWLGALFTKLFKNDVPTTFPTNATFRYKHLSNVYR